MTQVKVLSKEAVIEEIGWIKEEIALVEQASHLSENRKKEVLSKLDAKCWNMKGISSADVIIKKDKAEAMSKTVVPRCETVEHKVLEIAHLGGIHIIARSGFKTDHTGKIIPARQRTKKKNGVEKTFKFYGDVTIQFDPGVATTGFWDRDTESFDWYDCADIDYNWKSGRVSGSGVWELTIMSVDDGDIFCTLPGYTNKKGQRRNYVNITHPLHRIDPERDGLGIPVVNDINAALTAAAKLMMGDLWTQIDGRTRTWADGSPIKDSCVNCAHLIRMYQRQDGHPLLSMCDHSINDMKSMGIQTMPSSFCAMMLEDPLKDAWDIINEREFMDVYTEKVIVGREEEMDPLTGQMIPSRDEHGALRYTWADRRVALNKYVYNNRIHTRANLLKTVGETYGTGCPSYRFTGPTHKVDPKTGEPINWIRVNLYDHMVMPFTKIQIALGNGQYSDPVWSRGLPSDGHGLDNILTGEVMLSTGCGLFIDFDPAFWDVDLAHATMKYKEIKIEKKYSTFDHLNRTPEKFLADLGDVFISFIEANKDKGAEWIYNELLPVIEEDVPKALRLKALEMLSVAATHFGVALV